MSESHAADSPADIERYEREQAVRTFRADARKRAVEQLHAEAGNASRLGTRFITGFTSKDIILLSEYVLNLQRAFAEQHRLSRDNQDRIKDAIEGF